MKKMETLTDKLDLVKADRNYYHAGRNPELRDLDAYYYLTCEGIGDPNKAPFLKAIEQLYAVAYQIKFLCKKEDMDFVVPKMEGFWWIAGGPEVQHLFPQTPPDQWHWKIVIRMPDYVEADHYYRAVHQVENKKPELLKNNPVKYELINEGRAVQILHIGSYDEEKPTIDKLLNFARENGLEISGHHHEIYLSDPRKVPAEKLKTILRYAVK
jgi:hypothetical protein